MKKRLGVLGAIVIATSAAMLVPASPASAATCKRTVGYTIKDGHVIRGSGYHKDCLPATDTTMTLQWHRAWGWQKRTSTGISGANVSKSIAWDCSGTGTHTFRVILEWRDGGGTPHVVKSNELRASC
jgi:hypothetical protein